MLHVYCAVFWHNKRNNSAVRSREKWCDLCRFVCDDCSSVVPVTRREADALSTPVPVLAVQLAIFLPKFGRDQKIRRRVDSTSRQSSAVCRRYTGQVTGHANTKRTMSLL